MRSTTYAALWSDGDTPLAGSLALDGEALQFEGSRPGRHARRRISYEEIVSLRLGRENGERLRGRTALVIELDDGTTVRVVTAEPGTIHEVIDALTDVQRKVRS